MSAGDYESADRPDAAMTHAAHWTARFSRPIIFVILTLIAITRG
jgi:hypothetical protein